MPLLKVSALTLALLLSMAQTAPDALTRARQLYNAGKFSEAAAAAAEARLVPALANTAAVVYARARLEKYRETPDPADLDEGRLALRQVLALRADGSVAHAGPAAGLGVADARAIVEGRA